MAYVVSIINCMAHCSLSWHIPHGAANGYTPAVAHLMEFELLEPIPILDYKTQFPDSWEIFGYYTVLILIKVVLTATGYGLSSMAYLNVLSFITLTAPQNPIVGWYQ